jgi:hypothetical protein
MRLVLRAADAGALSLAASPGGQKLIEVAEADESNRVFHLRNKTTVFERTHNRSSQRKHDDQGDQQS